MMTRGGFWHWLLTLLSPRRDTTARPADRAAADRAREEAAARDAAARIEAAAILDRARAEAETERERAAREVEAQRDALAEMESHLDERESRLQARLSALGERDAAARNAVEALAQARTELEALRDRRLEALERQAGTARDAARDAVMHEFEREVREDVERRLRADETALQIDAETRARSIVGGAIQRLRPPAVPDPSADPLHNASPEARQKLLAREGSTLRAVEDAIGVELSVEELPGSATPSITLAGFDPVRREVARTALTWLIRDGAMNPTKVDQIISRAQREVQASIERAGLIAATQAACKDLPSEVVTTLGRLRYRTSYGQNQLQHAIETSRLATIIGHELGADVPILRAGALLHDLGKAVDRENEGTHAMLGGEICRRNSVNGAIVHCIEAHHEEIEPETLEARLTIIADSISGGRPGARRESLEHYLARLQALEEIAHSFRGVERAFAIQAGRELRILVRAEQVDDGGAAQLAKSVSEKIMDTMEYPGQIRVTVVRETRAVEYAR
jgi:ribonuclease Y